MRETLLARGLKELGIAASEQHITLLQTYAHAIENGNRQVNLVKAAGEELIINHLLDSLAGLKLIEQLWQEKVRAEATHETLNDSGRIADIGSGAGLPGIPLALFMPYARFTLIENSPRKAAFLKNMTERLKLPHVQVIAQDIQSVTALYPLIIFRAFTPLQKEIFRSVFARLASRGVLVAYKGRHTTIQEELAGLSPLISSQVSIEIVPVHVPFSDKERHLLVISKSA